MHTLCTEFWACYFCLKNSNHIDVWLGFNQLVSCAHAYPVYYEFEQVILFQKYIDVWLGFNQDVSCVHAYPVYYEFWACYFCYIPHWCLTWIQPGCKLWLCISSVLSMLLLFQKLKPYWCFTWIQPASKLCSCIPCVLWVLSMLFLYQKYIPHWRLTWIQPACKLCSCRSSV